MLHTQFPGEKTHKPIFIPFFFVFFHSKREIIPEGEYMTRLHNSLPSPFFRSHSSCLSPIFFTRPFFYGEFLFAMYFVRNPTFVWRAFIRNYLQKENRAVFKRADGPRPSPQASTFLLYFEVENLDSPSIISWIRPLKEGRRQENLTTMTGGKPAL